MEQLGLKRERKGRLGNAGSCCRAGACAAEVRQRVFS